jgi:choline dehydrogenase-like flavoprotein
MAAGAACGRAAALQCGALLLRRALCSSAAAEQAAPVVIVGAGPTGLTLSRLLSQQGVRSLLLEAAPALTTHPQVSQPSVPALQGLSQQACMESWQGGIKTESMRWSMRLRIPRAEVASL